MLLTPLRYDPALNVLTKPSIGIANIVILHFSHQFELGNINNNFYKYFPIYKYFKILPHFIQHT